jgi:hypothetical protein
MSSLKPLMYAELLSNIRQVSVIVALQEPCDLTTKVELSADGRRFILRHGHSGEASSLSLPGQVSPSFQLQRPVFGARELTWRLPLAGEPICTSMDTKQSNCAPWSAKFLGKETEFVCRACGSEIVKKGSIGTWRDLPSENWAEMMDFWHCHKPEVPDGHVEQSAANRGYGANTKFTPTPGIGFVDLTSFLLADTDCQNTQVRDTFLLKAGSVARSTARVSRRWPGLLLLFNGLVTDTSTQNQHPVTTLRSRNPSCLPLFLDCGFTCLIGGYDLGISLCIFLEISEAIGLARGTYSELKLAERPAPQSLSFSHEPNSHRGGSPARDVPISVNLTKTVC